MITMYFYNEMINSGLGTFAYRVFKWCGTIFYLALYTCMCISAVSPLASKGYDYVKM